MLAESTGGDIRSAINALQFSCLREAKVGYSQIFQGANTSVSSSKKTKQPTTTPAVTASKSDRAAVGGKDQSLVLFHGLGKVLYAKRLVTGPPEPFPLPVALERHRRRPLIAKPEEVIENTAIR
jgi:cell cycle checkpoint protein